MKNKNINICYLSQVPGPYREKMHEIVAQKNNFSYSVIYCAKLEPNRTWTFDYGDYTKFFLTENAKTFRHNNPSVWKLLNKLDPAVLIITAFKPTMLYGVLWCILNRRKIVVYNDGTFNSEKSITPIQKTIRKIVYKITAAFMAPGKGTFDLYKSYHIPENKMFKSCLCVDNSQFVNENMDDREFHIMFAGQIVKRKLPLFFAEIAIKLNKLIPNFKVLVVGDGELKNEMSDLLNQNNVSNHFTGFLDQKTLPNYYSKSKLFLFTTNHDEWGIVANEACASGTPVITSNDAGAADDLIIHNQNGYVLPLVADEWVEHILHLLEDAELLKSFSKKSIQLVAPFTHQQAAEGLANAVNFAIRSK